MSFMRERSARRFFILTALACALLTVALCCLAGVQARSARRMLLAREGMIAGALLEQGVPPDAVATALARSEPSDAGTALLRRLGRTEETAVRFLPSIRAFGGESAAGLLAVCACFAATLLLHCAAYLLRRDRLYREATRVIDRYAESDFSRRLPQTEEGAFGQLLSEVDGLATALRAKGDTECRSKEFLQRMVSDISHQLKTPLAAIRLHGEIIAAEADCPETVIAFSKKTEDALERMEQLIAALLKVARIDAGSIVFERAPCRVRALAERAASELTARAAREQKHLEISGEADAQIVCDPQWTGEAIGNLIKNALDHTEPGGRVNVIWERTPLMLRISVSDDGEGIDPEDIHHIFKRFYRSARAVDRQGVGLGLPLARAIVEGQGGTLSVMSAPGQGSTFTIAFMTKP